VLGRSEVGRGIGRGGAGCAVERAAESVLGRVRGEEGKRVGPGVRGKGLGRAGRELGLGFWEVGWKTGLGLKHGLGWETEFWAGLG
jgi:hypothetical protein